MSLAGTGAVAIWHDLLPDATEDFYEWHNREHMPERVGIPGFRRGRRYIAIEGAPKYFNLYEADSPEVLSGGDYVNRLNAPTDWTKRVVPSFKNVARSICRVVFSSGVGSGGTILTMRFDIPAANRAAAIEALVGRILSPLSLRNGISGAHLCLADEAISNIETSEKNARADTTLVPTWIGLLEGNSVRDVRAAGHALVSELQPLGATSPEIGIYTLEFTRLKTPWSAG